MRSAAFTAAERKRRQSQLATAPQRHEITRLAITAGMETPVVHWRREASKVIAFLRGYVRQPSLSGVFARG